MDTINDLRKIRLIFKKINFNLLKYENKKISFQGLKGAYSDLACNKFYKEYEPFPCTTFEQALDAVRNNNAFLAMIPVENNIAGRVADMHVLLQSLKLKL